MFVEFRRHIPSLSPWIEACYSCQPNLLLGTHSLLSCSGVQQGDPLVTLQPIIDCIQSKVTLNAWYMDDGTLVGSPNDLLSVMKVQELELAYTYIKPSLSYTSRLTLMIQFARVSLSSAAPSGLHFKPM